MDLLQFKDGPIRIIEGVWIYFKGKQLLPFSFLPSRLPDGHHILKETRPVCIQESSPDSAVSIR